MDQAAMCEQERWLEIARTMTFEVAFFEAGSSAEADVEATQGREQAETIHTAKTSEPEGVETAPEPRTARVLSISQLRQKLGIEDVVAAPARRMQQPVAGPPRIVRRRGECAMQGSELMAG